MPHRRQSQIVGQMTPGAHNILPCRYARQAGGQQFLGADPTFVQRLAGLAGGFSYRCSTNAD